MARYVVCALYKFVSLPDFRDIQPKLQLLMNDHQVCGTLLLAEEGINGTIAGSREGIDHVLNGLRQDARFTDLETKESETNERPFLRAKVKLKKEIVTLGVDGIDPNICVGTYVNPKDWNRLISEPDVLLIDTRNDYEYAIGTFKGAVNPETTTFREFPDYVQQHLDPARHKKVAMFCTGGIRCEKGTALMKQLGFDDVYHLKGGILKYLEEVHPEESLWEGECFVFDERVSVDHHLQPGQYSLCHACRHPLSQDDLASTEFESGVSCPHCIGKHAPEKVEALREREHQMQLANQRGMTHIGSNVVSSASQRRQEKLAAKNRCRAQQQP